MYDFFSIKLFSHRKTNENRAPIGGSEDREIPRFGSRCTRYRVGARPTSLGLVSIRDEREGEGGRVKRSPRLAIRLFD